MHTMNHNALNGIITHLYTQPKLSNFLQIDLEKTKAFCFF